MDEASGRAGRCPRCGDARVTRCGHAANGVQRLACGGCARSFGARLGTALAGLHDEAAFGRVLADMMGDVQSSCRTLAARLGLDKSTVWRWRQRINRALAGDDRARVAAVLEAVPLRLRESRKASREWVNHQADPASHPAPDRPRWVDVDRGRLPPPVPLERFLVTVAIGCDRARGCIARVLGVGLGWSPGGEPRLDSRSALAPGELARALESFAAPDGQPQPGAPSPRPFKSFLAPFRGPATRHLAGYAAWFTVCCDPSIARREARAWQVLRAGVEPAFFADMRNPRGVARVGGV
jgi:transposase-like protein